MTHFEKKTVRREIPQQKETLPSNYSIQRNTVTEQEENIFSHFTSPQNHFITKFY